MAARRLLPARKPLRDTLAANRAATRAYGLTPEQMQTPASLAYLDKPKRAYAKRGESHGATEAQVLDAIRSAFALHPRVAFCWRMQSGLFVDGNRHIRVGFPGLPDLIGALKGGQFFAVEVKREFGAQVSSTQVETLQMINISGGVAGIARSVEDALKIIEQ